MSVYSNYEVYPRSFDEMEYPVSCYNCSRDCPGILLEIFKEVGDQQ